MSKNKVPCNAVPQQCPDNYYYATNFIIFSPGLIDCPYLPPDGGPQRAQTLKVNNRVVFTE